MINIKMKEIKSAEKIKRFAKKKWDNFTDWFTEKEHPRSRLNKNVFFHDSLKLIGFILVFLIINSNLDKINQIVLIFIKLGSLLQLVLLFFILRKAWHIIINLKYAFRGLNHGTKAIIAIAIVLLLFFAFVNQDKVVDSFVQTYEETDFNKLNPIKMPSNFSLGSIASSGGISYSSIKDLHQNPSNYIGRNVSIKGKLNNRLGGYSLEDSDGYWVWIEDNCIESQRDYNYNSQTYVAKGTWRSPKKDEYGFGWGVEYKYRLSCISPLS